MDSTDEPSIKRERQFFSGFNNLTKGFLGAASFELPWALQQGGVWAGAISLVIFAVICSYTLKLLGRCKKFVNVPDQNKATLVQVGEQAFGATGRKVVNVGVIAMSLGVCSAYLVFVGSTLHSVFAEYRMHEFYLGSTCDNLDASTPGCIVFPLVIAMPVAVWIAMIKDYKRLAPVSVAGICLVCLSMLFVVVEGLVHLDENSGGHHSIADTKVYPFLDWQHYPLFFGNAAFLFCIHTVAIPIHTSMSEGSDPDDFDRAVNASTTFVAVLNIVFAVMCFWIYGDKVQSNIVQNLPAGNIVTTIIKVLLVFVMIFTYGLFIQPLAELVENMYSGADQGQELGNPSRHLSTDISSGTKEESLLADSFEGEITWSGRCRQYGIRIALILVTLGLALSIPDFGLVCNLVGSVANTTLGLVFPAVFYIKLKSDSVDDLPTKLEVVLNAGIVLFASVLMVTSGGVTVVSIACANSKGLSICSSAPFDHT